MFLFTRKALALIGASAAAVASTAVLATPAQAASAGLAKVVGTTVQFQALNGKANNLVISISGRTVTLDDSVALKPGKGCRKVDKTKVRCTTKKATKLIKVALGDRNDAVKNKTRVALLANGGPGNDKLTGGSGADELRGGAGNDRIWGVGGDDYLIGGNGNDVLSAGDGYDWADGGAGDDKLLGGNHDDFLDGGAGVDRIYAGAGDDTAFGDTGNDFLYGEAGFDGLVGEAGNDVLSGSTEDDLLIAESFDESLKPVGSATATDKLDGGPQLTGDVCLALAGATKANCELSEIPLGDLAAASAGGVAPELADVKKRLLEARTK
ncbi:calcium-binding protein [Actinoplanes sp. NPDC023714]|uniref:calcium-binding protein n=1 Tax=Actinoplanes sp. NPDC023714 TaxID=3154322 RepID=UPI0033EDE1FC